MARDHGGAEIIPGQVITPNAFDDQFGTLIAKYATVHIAGEAAPQLAKTLPPSSCSVQVAALGGSSAQNERKYISRFRRSHGCIVELRARASQF